MSTTAAASQTLLNHSAINGWRLFWLIAIPMCIVMLVEMLRVGVTTAPGVSDMIGFSVRISVPFIFLVLGTSALHTLFPAPSTRWLLRNRKQLGLCFALAMAWQGFFIAVMSVFFRDYYYDEIFYLRDELEGSTGYLFLAAMVVTSFKFGRKRVSQQQWRLLHLSGLYFLWAYPFSVYWWNLYYYPSPGTMDYLFYAAGFTAFALRIAAWGKRRLLAARRASPPAAPALIGKLAGFGLIAAGLVASATGLQWQDPVSTLLTLPAWSANLELWLPFWPFEPFLPLAVIGLGTLLATRTKAA